MAENTTRKSISKKIRFEVFKRDSFKCQYCGASAPDVLLQVDHIKPVAENGTNDIINLITACESCNNGKGKILLSDSSAIQKQKKQLDNLNERREQLEMLVDWQKTLFNIEEDEVSEFLEYYNTVNGCNILLTNYGKAELKKQIKKYGLKSLFEASNIVFERYSNLDAGNRYDKIGGVLYFLNASEFEKQAMYIKGICRNRLNYFDPKIGMPLIKAVLQQYKYEFVCEIAKDAKNWSHWKWQMNSLHLDPDDENTF